MDAQPSTSSGAIDQRRQDALKSYREVYHIEIRDDYHWLNTHRRKCAITKQ